MNRHLATLTACLVLGFVVCAYASQRSTRRDKDKDADSQVKQAQKAAKVKIIHGPAVEGVHASDATIAWSTNVKASTILLYGTSPSHLGQSAEARWGAVTHRVQLRHLKPGTTYYYRVESTQALSTGSQVLSPVEQFRTSAASASAAKPARAAAVKVTHGPVVEGTHAHSATIAWSTNVGASTILIYGTNPRDLNQTAEARWGGLTHRVQLHNLKPGTTYYYQIQSTQAQGTGTQATSAVEQFRTPGATAAAARPAATHPVPASKASPRDTAMHNFHQFLVTHPNIRADLQKNPYLTRNGHYMVQHPGFSQFLQTHPGVKQYLAQNPKAFLQGEAMAR